MTELTVSAEQLFPLTLKIEMLPETVQLIAEAKSLTNSAKSISIDTVESYEVAAVELSKIKANFKSIEEQRKALTKPLDDVKKQIMDYVRPFSDGLTSAESLLKQAMIAFNEKQESLRKAEEAKLLEEQRKLQEKLLEKADKAEEKGKSEQADFLREQAATTVAAPAVQSAPRVSGISTRKVYSAEVVDLMALVKAVAAGTVPLKVLQADTKVLNAMAKALEGDFAYPGCKLVAATSMAARAAK